MALICSLLLCILELCVFIHINVFVFVLMFDRALKMFQRIIPSFLSLYNIALHVRSKSEPTIWKLE